MTADATDPSADTSTPHTRVAIVGSGFAGLGLAITLMRAGIDDLAIYERAGAVGGTWRDNTYPGCQCDVPSHLYSFSFAPNPEWSRSFALQHEIRAYLERCADTYRLRPKVRLDAEVLDASWDVGSQRWNILTASGPATADILVAAHGPLSEPAYPDLTGLETFEGTTFHSAAWDHDHDLTGERVAVIGTGASAIQFVPAIQPDVGRLELFQRTAPWVVPRSDRPIPERTRRIMRRFPFIQRAARGLIYWSRELMVIPLAKRPSLMRHPQRLAADHLARQVPDPDLRAKLTPSYDIGCKRILLSNEYYPALNQPNVDVVTEPIREVQPHAVVTADGVTHEVDTIIFGTGFRVTDHPIAGRIRGRTGKTLAEAWSDGMQAYLGTTVTGFPNLFVMVGPNTGLGHTSMVFMMESQFAYIVDCLSTMDARDVAEVEVRADAQRRFNESLQGQLKSSIWNSGCASWYLDAQGRNTTLWPTFTWTYRRRTATFDLDAYRLVARAPAGTTSGSIVAGPAGSPGGRSR